MDNKEKHYLGSKMTKVVIVEDDEDIKQTISDHLELLGFETDSCLNDRELTELLNQYQPDLILLDVRLPQKSGIEIAKDLKSNSQTKHIPLIAVSGSSNIDDIQTYTSIGFADTCPKPINYTDLMMKIARLMSC